MSVLGLSKKEKLVWLSWSMPAIWMVHGMAFFCLALLHHVTALEWLSALGFQIRAQCFGPSGSIGAGGALQHAQTPVGLLLGAIGAAAGIYALMISRTRPGRAHAVCTVLLNLLIVAPRMVVLGGVA